MSQTRASQPPLPATGVVQLERCLGILHSASKRWQTSARKLGSGDPRSLLLAVAPFGGLGEVVGETEEALGACWSALRTWLGEEIRAASLEGDAFRFS